MIEIKIDQTLDLKNTPCPINFVKTKLRLEEMRGGEILEVFLDDGEPIINVASSVKEEGHQILKVEQIKDYWRLIIKKI
jgi:tRNA 2-thiouridine synthesizing protein A